MKRRHNTFLDDGFDYLHGLPQIGVMDADTGRTNPCTNMTIAVATMFKRNPRGERTPWFAFYNSRGAFVCLDASVFGEQDNKEKQR